MQKYNVRDKKKINPICARNYKKSDKQRVSNQQNILKTSHRSTMHCRTVRVVYGPPNDCMWKLDTHTIRYIHVKHTNKNKLLITQTRQIRVRAITIEPKTGRACLEIIKKENKF